YSFEYQTLAKNVATAIDIELKEGIYLATQGPNYETKSEVKMFRAFGADAVGMSTVFEVLACNFLNMKVLAFSCITNKAADLHKGSMCHEEVLESLNQMSPKLSRLTTALAKEMLN
nr:Purine nucleoside phosphorylase 1 [Candidatus Anoxychlamydiales bacterium]